MPTPAGKGESATTAAFRHVIRELVRGLCAVPIAVRKEWADELIRKEKAHLTPDEIEVKMVLINLDVAEGNANHLRQQMAPKLHMIGQQGPGDPATRRPGKRPGPAAQPRPDSAPPAA